MANVAVCVPYHDRVHAQFAASLVGVMQRDPNAYLIMVRSSIVTKARNACIEAVEQKGDIDLIFFADSDMTFPPDTIERLASHDKDIVGATYLNKIPPYPIMVKSIDDKPILATSGLSEVAALPFGCILLRRSVFAKFRRPYFRFIDDEATGQTHGEDGVFCHKARELGYKLLVDID